MSSGLMVLANHNIDAQEILELGNKVENKISGFSLVNREQLKELILLEYDDYYEYQYGDVNENERIEAKIIKMSRDPKDNKIKFEKEFTTEQEMKQLRIASKEFAKIEKDRIINDTGFECNYWQCGDKMVGVYVTGMGLLFDIDYNIIIFKRPILYKDWFHLHKFIRDEWRKYFYQIINLFGGNKAIYISCDNFDLMNEYFHYREWIHYNDVLYQIEECLVEIFGENNKKIDRIAKNEYCDYVIDDFSDINLDKNMEINDFKKYVKYFGIIPSHIPD